MIIPGNWSGFYDALQELSELMQVKMLNIKNGTVNYRSLSDSSITAKLSGFNISVLLNDFLKSKSLSDIKHSIPYLVAGKIIYHSQALTGEVNQLRLIGSMQQSMTNKIEIELANGMKFKGKEIYLKDLDWDELINKNAIIADSVSIGDLTAGNDHLITGNGNNIKVTEFPLINIRKLGINEFKVHYIFSAEDNAEAKAKGKDIMFTDLATVSDTFLWSNVAGVFTNFEYTSPGVSASSDKINFETPGETRLIRIKADVIKSNATIHSVIPEIKLESTLTSTDFSRADLSAIIINQPLLEVTQTLARDSGSKPFTLPFDFTIGSTNINGAQIRYKLNNGIDSVQISSTVSGSLDSLMSGIREFESFHFSKLNLALSEITIHHEKLNAEIPSLEFIASDAGIYNEEGRGSFQSFISANWNHVAMDLSLEKNSKVKVNNFSGMLEESKLELNAGEKFQWKEWLNRLQVLSARLLFSDSARNVSLNNIQWSPGSQELQIDSFLMQPKISQREYFRKTPWQSEYIRLHGSSITVSGIDFDKWKNDSLFQVSKISFNGIAVDAWRDRRIPFKHGIEKSMPTRLINSISYHFNIDSVTVKNGDVQYHEFSNITGREGIVPLKNINATVLNVKNYHEGNTDTLSIRGKAKILNYSIKKFRYAEAYNDSLGSFRLSARVSPGPLNEFSRISNPLAAIDINEGVLDTMAVRISGNKYAAFGEIVFYYHDLKIKLLDHEDTTRKRISLSFANFVTNRFVIKTNNRKQSVIFYIRDREKFVFNYWVKALMSGMLASAGVKRSKAYKKQYQKLKGEYTLPELTF